MDEEKWMMCSTCLVLVRSTKNHFLQYSHRFFHVPGDGILDLVCSDCEINLSNLQEAELHVENHKGHKVMGKSMEDDAMVLSLSKKDVIKIKNLGVELEGMKSVTGLGPNTGSGYSTEEVTDKKKAAEFDEKSKLATDKVMLIARRRLTNLQLDQDQIAILKDKYVIVEDTDRQDAINRIDEVLESSKVDKDVLRFSLTNVNQKQNTYEFEVLLKQICLKKNIVICTTENKKQASKAERLQMMLGEIKTLLQKDNQLRIHEIPYTYPLIYGGQSLSDSDLREISALLGITRESLNIYTLPTGSIKGQVSLFVGEKLLTNCSLGGSSGCKIPTEADKITSIRSQKKIAFILVVEKDTIFQALADRGFPEQNNCVLVTGSGQPSVSTRILVRKLVDMLHVPVYGLFDANPSGAQIYTVYRYGSENRAFDGLCLTVPMVWIGLFIQDVEEVYRTRMAVPVDTPKDIRKIKSKKRDGRMKILNDLMGKDHIRNDQSVFNILSSMKVHREVAELDILTRYYHVEDYILEKIEASELPPW